MRSFDASERTFVRGEEEYLIDICGRKVYDAVSSIWTTIHGHCHPYIVEAIAKQAAKLDHATTLGASNPVAEELAARLCDLTKMDCAFFASDGASAVEAAMKMALQYWQNSGQPERTRFVKLVDAYHGDTIGAMSVSDIAVFKSRFGAVTFETIPYDLPTVLQGDIAAVIVEPIVQAAAGMRLVPKSTYSGLRDIEPLLIVDEIATGFGRTGTMFAFEQLDLHPDVLCIGKGITGGTLALSATLASARIFDAFLSEPVELKHFFHGHSYAGNPIACAAALASLELFEREDTLAHVARLSDHVEQRLQKLQQKSMVCEIRQAGLMAGIQIDPPPEEPTYAWKIVNGLYRCGHFTRPIGNVIQFVPPLSSKIEQIDAFFDALTECLTS
jgi:adenosylmethionine-8-amino-7-oxononanoate aminotransferase